MQGFIVDCLEMEMEMNIYNGRAVAWEQEPVVVIDPGHGGTEGGTDDGAAYNGVTERFINMATARAMYDELSQYDGVKVYLTHDSAMQHMTLGERAEFAKSVNADYLISIHYNASEEHIFYGSEVWIPSIGKYYAQGYGMADILIDGFREKGLHIRGIKTRVGDGNDEYYGIIRESEHRDITAIIIEHCHVDNENDLRYFDSESDYEEFGKADATAVAKYLGLHSSVNGADYTGYETISVNQPAQRVFQDTTPPDLCEVVLSEPVQGNGQIKLTIEGADHDTEIGYYAYSFNGGEEYSDLFEWRDMDHDGREEIIISNIERKNADFVVRVYNNYNLYTDSQVLSIQGINQALEETEYMTESEGTKETKETAESAEITENTDKVTLVEGTGYAEAQNNRYDVLKIGGVTAFVLSGMVLTTFLYRKLRRKQRKDKHSGKHSGKE